MSESVSVPTEGPDTVSVPASAGTLLREAREAQGAHVAALAVVLKVPVHQIEALEADRLDQMPDLVFARALAASVCRHLKIDPATVLARLPAGQPRLHREREPINEPFRTAGESSGSSWRDRLARPPVTIALVLLLGAVILLALPLFQGDTEPAPAPAGAPAIAAPEPAAPASAPGLAMEPVAPLVPAVPAAAPTATPGGSVTENVTPAAR